MPGDCIIIKGLEVETHVGVTSEERSSSQVVIIDVEVAVDLGPAAMSNNVSDTVDYGGLTVQIAERVRALECNTLERLANEVAGVALDHACALGAVVEVYKANPPIDEKVQSVSVRMERRS